MPAAQAEDKKKRMEGRSEEIVEAATAAAAAVAAATVAAVPEAPQKTKEDGR